MLVTLILGTGERVFGTSANCKAKVGHNDASVDVGASQGYFMIANRNEEEMLFFNESLHHFFMYPSGN